MTKEETKVARIEAEEKVVLTMTMTVTMRKIVLIVIIIFILSHLKNIVIIFQVRETLKDELEGKKTKKQPRVCNRRCRISKI